jgi:hypothetical protein
MAVRTQQVSVPLTAQHGVGCERERQQQSLRQQRGREIQGESTVLVAISLAPTSTHLTASRTSATLMLRT